MARVKTTTRVAASGRVRLRNLRSSLHTVNTTDTVSAPFTFSQNGFTLTFAYKMTDFGPGNPFANAEGWFNQLGSLSYARQGTNDVQIYAYLNASADFAGPRRMRFGNIPFPKGDGRWHRQTILIYVNASNHAICDIYEDGVALSLGNTVNYTGDVATPSGNLRFCGSTANSARGWMSEVKIFNNRKFTASEIAAHDRTGINPYPPDAQWMLNEGAGTTAYDTSGNGNHGTITGSTYSSEVPVAPRQLINPNLLKTNADLSFVPPGNTPTTGNARWIDNTAAGGATGIQNNIFGWYQNFGGTCSAMIDTANLTPNGKPSLKLSTLAVASFQQCWNSGMTYFSPNGIQVIAGVSYTYSFYMKTNYVSGDSADGAFMKFDMCDSGSGTSGISQANSTVVKTTTGWTLYTGTFTPSARTAYLTPECRIYGNTGAATLIMDAWFGEISIKPTTPTARITP